MPEFLAALRKLIRHETSSTRYARMYPCTIVSQDATGRLNLKPDDTDLSSDGIDRVPIKFGLPGALVVVPPGGRIMLGFENSDPTRPYAAAWEGVTAFISITIGGLIITPAGVTFGPPPGAPPGATAEVSVGDGANFVALENLVATQLTILLSAIAASPVVALDGGASFKAGILSALTAWPASVASSNLKAD